MLRRSIFTFLLIVCFLSSYATGNSVGIILEPEVYAGSQFIPDGPTETFNDMTHQYVQGSGHGRHIDFILGHRSVELWRVDLVSKGGSAGKQIMTASTGEYSGLYTRPSSRTATAIKLCSEMTLTHNHNVQIIDRQRNIIYTHNEERHNEAEEKFRDTFGRDPDPSVSPTCAIIYAHGHDIAEVKIGGANTQKYPIDSMTIGSYSQVPSTVIEVVYEHPTSTESVCIPADEVQTFERSNHQVRSKYNDGTEQLEKGKFTEMRKTGNGQTTFVTNQRGKEFFLRNFRLVYDRVNNNAKLRTRPSVGNSIIESEEEEVQGYKYCSRDTPDGVTLQDIQGNNLYRFSHDDFHAAQLKYAIKRMALRGKKRRLFRSRDFFNQPLNSVHQPDQSEDNVPDYEEYQRPQCYVFLHRGANARLARLQLTGREIEVDNLVVCSSVKSS